MFVLAVASAGCNVPRPVSQGPGGDAQVWAGIQAGMLRFDLVCLEHLLPKTGLCSQRVLEGKEGWSWNVPILPGITTDGREREGPATASRLGTKRRNWLRGAHGVLPPRPRTATSASASKQSRQQHPSKRLSRQPHVSRLQTAAEASAAELISACNQWGMKGR